MTATVFVKEKLFHLLNPSFAAFNGFYHDAKEGRQKTNEEIREEWEGLTDQASRGAVKATSNELRVQIGPVTSCDPLNGHSFNIGKFTVVFYPNREIGERNVRIMSRDPDIAIRHEALFPSGIGQLMFGGACLGNIDHAVADLVRAKVGIPIFCHETLPEFMLVGETK